MPDTLIVVATPELARTLNDLVDDYTEVKPKNYGLTGSRYQRVFVLCDLSGIGDIEWAYDYLPTVLVPGGEIVYQ